MTADAQKVRSIFLTAVENHAPEQWGRYLDEACAGDAGLRRRVEVLLRAHQQPNSLLDGPTPAPELPATLDEQLAASVFGHGGPGDRTDGVARLVGLVVSIDPTIGGSDTITDGAGADVIIGGTAGDTITAGEGANVVVGDSGVTYKTHTEAEGAMKTVKVCTTN